MRRGWTGGLPGGLGVKGWFCNKVWKWVLWGIWRCCRVFQEVCNVAGGDLCVGVGGWSCEG